MRFTGKTVVVLGGNSGIGLAAARAFQAEGARVAITGRNKETLAQAAAASGMLAVRSDMSSVADSRVAIARIAEQLGGIDVLFVNAGVGRVVNNRQLEGGDVTWKLFQAGFPTCGCVR